MRIPVPSIRRCATIDNQSVCIVVERRRVQRRSATFDAAYRGTVQILSEASLLQRARAILRIDKSGVQFRDQTNAELTADTHRL